MGCLSFMGMDVFFNDTFCDAYGSHVDMHFMNASSSNDRIAAAQQQSEIQYVGYTDK
jgi:hypothetical protein